MITESTAYHRQREQQCRAMAESAADPDVRRRHQQLADLHAGAAEQSAPSTAEQNAPGVAAPA